MHTGVNLKVNGLVNLTEGEVGGICLTIDYPEQSRERVIPISVSFVCNSPTIGMLCILIIISSYGCLENKQSYFILLFADESDFNITNHQPSIPIGVSEVCFQVVAVDDDIVENEEEFFLIIKPLNLNDMVNGNVTCFISDNDGKKD